MNTDVSSLFTPSDPAPKRRAVIVLTDEPDGTVSCEITNHPPLTEHEVSGAAQYAQTFANLMRIAKLHDHRPPRFTVLRSTEPVPLAEDPRLAAAELYGYARRIGRLQALDHFIANMHRADSVPSRRPEEWPAAVSREVLSRFRTMCEAFHPKLPAPSTSASPRPSPPPNFSEATTSAVAGAEPGQP